MLQLVSNGGKSIDLGQEDCNRLRRFQLAKLLQCTEDILVSAQKGDWESVEAMEHSRKTEIASCFFDIDSEESPLVAEVLASLICMNEQIMTLVIRAKQETVIASQSLTNGKSAVKNYQKYQSSRESI